MRMRFYYESQADVLGIYFQPGRPEGQKAARRREVMPGIWMEFDQRRQLAKLEIHRASQHDPNLKHMVKELVQEITRRSGEMAKEALLAIEKTIRLGDDPQAAQAVNYQPGFNFDAASNVLVVEFFKPAVREDLLPKKQVADHIFAAFDQDGRLVSMDIQSALQQFPDLQRFIQQGQEMQAMQHLFRA